MTENAQKRQRYSLWIEHGRGRDEFQLVLFHPFPSVSMGRPARQGFPVQRPSAKAQHGRSSTVAARAGAATTVGAFGGGGTAARVLAFAGRAPDLAAAVALGFALEGGTVAGTAGRADNSKLTALTDNSFAFRRP